MNESYLLFTSSRPFVFSLSVVNHARNPRLVPRSRPRPGRDQETARLPTSLTGGAVTLNDPAAPGKTTVSATARRIHVVVQPSLSYILEKREGSDSKPVGDNKKT